ncbi:hypothetical protein BAE44_0025530 [Dichanthelium oligosanthes]|uniref:Uncharacterized protein n=1 Tax=Dichanthelium oligosanthes TaxID=888268 RepID=A0A1E5UKP7_9POAL|nr:hypothetical protein BAE44_0025530 [Dichanthelium oligosanthes]
MLRIQFLAPAAGSSALDWWLLMREGLNKVKRKGIDSTFMLISWKIWKEWNNRILIFNDQRRNVNQTVVEIIDEGKAWIDAGAKHLGSLGWPLTQGAGRTRIST